MASMDGGARNVLSAVAAAGRALKEVPAATWDARPGADATAPTLETDAVAVWWRVKLEPGCPSSSSNYSSSESHCVLASAMPLPLSTRGRWRDGDGDGDGDGDRDDGVRGNRNPHRKQKCMKSAKTSAPHASHPGDLAKLVEKDESKAHEDEPQSDIF